MMLRNDISEDSKKTFHTRTRSAIIYCFYWIGFFLLGIFSDPNGIGTSTLNGWANYISQDVRFVLALVLIIYLIPVIFIASKEISNCFFNRNIKINQFICFVLLLLFTSIPTIVYLIPYYGFNVYAKTSNDITLAFAYATVSCLIFSVIVSLIQILVNRKLNWFNGFIYPLLSSCIGFFFMSCLYLTFIRGWTTLLFLFALVSFTDVFAYVGGLLHGKHKMCPKISPKKTWEGAIISIIVTTLVMLGILGIFYLFPQQFNILKNIFGIQFGENIANNWTATAGWWVSMTFIILFLVIFSMCGDLSFSWIKRKIQIKDFGNIMPGHGGVLDRIDSLSFAVITYVIFTMIISGFSSTTSFFPFLV